MYHIFSLSIKDTLVDNFDFVLNAYLQGNSYSDIRKSFIHHINDFSRELKKEDFDSKKWLINNIDMNHSRNENSPYYWLEEYLLSIEKSIIIILWEDTFCSQEEFISSFIRDKINSGPSHPFMVIGKILNQVLRNEKIEKIMKG